MLGIAVFRRTGGHQLHLFELVLADHAARIAATTAGFGAETHRMGGHAQWQTLGVDDLLAHDIGQRHFGGGDQITARLAHFGLKQIVFEFRQLTGAAHRIGIDQQRHVGFFVTVFAHMQVQHELRQRTVQTRDRTTQHGEPRTRQFGCRFAIQPAVRRTEFHMVLDGEIELTRRTPTRLLEVLALVLAKRHTLGRQIGQAKRDAFELGANRIQRVFGRLELIAEPGHFGHQRGHVFALGLGLPDRLGFGIALALQFLRAHLDTLALALQRLQFRSVQGETARAAQALGKVGRVLAKQGRI